MVPTRILILSWEYPPLVEGGLARHVRKLSEQLVAHDVEVHVLTRGQAEMAAEEEVAGVHVHRVREPSKPRDLDEFLSWIERMNGDMVAAGLELCERLSFDLVHGHDWLVATAGDELARHLRCPWVVTVHATEYGRHQGWVDKHPQSHIHGVETWMANNADAVITCSSYMREHVTDVYGLDDQRVAVIPNGIDPLDLQPVEDLDALRARFAAPHERLVLLVGRLVYEKGFQIALEALPGVIERLGDVRFLVAGSGTAEEELRGQAARLGLDAHGTFMGWIGDDVLHSLYRIADLTVVPSIYEPFGLVALEAMASGCPTIVADTGGLREVVPTEEVGLRFDDGARAVGRVAARAADRRGQRARAQLRLGRHRPPDGRRLRRAGQRPRGTRAGRLVDRAAPAAPVPPAWVVTPPKRRRRAPARPRRRLRGGRRPRRPRRRRRRPARRSPRARSPPRSARAATP
jgi:glycogen synthase